MAYFCIAFQGECFHAFFFPPGVSLGAVFNIIEKRGGEGARSCFDPFLTLPGSHSFHGDETPSYDMYLGKKTSHCRANVVQPPFWSPLHAGQFESVL